MLRFTLRRALRALITLATFQTLLFLAAQALPGDYAAMSTRAANSRALRSTLGLSAPLWQQYSDWMIGFFTLDLGRSFDAPHEPVVAILARALPVSLWLYAPAMLIGAGVGILAGTRLAPRPGRGGGIAAPIAGTALAASFPPWMAFSLINVFAFRLGWLPAEGLADDVLWSGTPLRPATVIVGILAAGVAAGILSALLWRITRHLQRRIAWRISGLAMLFGAIVLGPWGGGLSGLVVDLLRHWALPLLTLTLLAFGESLVIMHSAMRVGWAEAHVWTARAKGLSTAIIRDRHVARPALGPVIARSALQFSLALAGSLTLERLFHWHGMGQTLFDAATRQDLPVLMGSLSVLGLLVLTGTVFVDVLNAWLDPRLRADSADPHS